MTEEDERVRLSSPTKVEFVWEPEEELEESPLSGARLESVDLVAPEHTHSKEAFERASKMDPALDPVAHTLLTTTPHGASKSMVNHHYGKSPVETGPPPTREDAEAVLAWEGFGAHARSEAVRRRREREERELPGHPAERFTCAHCGEMSLVEREGTMNRGNDWYCNITCLNAEVTP